MRAENIITSIINEITDSNMPLNKKMIILKKLDKVFRQYYGIIYLSDRELNQKDILLRSM
ncbi:MAG: hypothetical protein COA88_08990 [Kordia sp.]|nr:MAG: hypothetical protein COA88_08990 [Kordia sp.]